MEADRLSDMISWDALTGGYGTPYDPRPAVAATQFGNGWDVLWENLYHQGDVGDASYAAVPLIAELVGMGAVTDWNAYALVATIEEARADPRSPPLPSCLAASYARGWDRMFEAGLAALPQATDELLVAAIFAVLAAHKRQPALSRLALRSEAERQRLLDEAGWA